VTPKAVTLSEGSDPSVCPCGRSHARPRKPRKHPGLVDHATLVDRIYDAKAEGRAAQRDRLGEWDVDYSHNCERPLPMRRSASSGALFATLWVRCRQCPPCLRANMWRWLRSMEGHILDGAANGKRTWFGTITLRPEAQGATLHQAMLKWMHEHAHGSGVPDWWDDPNCDFRFAMHREVLLHELQKYWKRLRKAGHQFKYIVVFERHKSGWPHMHCLVHEVGDKITKAALQGQWPHGFTQMKLVDGDARKAAYYVSKYLSKSRQARQLASVRYDLVKYPLNG